LQENLIEHLKTRTYDSHAVPINNFYYLLKIGKVYSALSN